MGVDSSSQQVTIVEARVESGKSERPHPSKLNWFDFDYFEVKNGSEAEGRLAKEP